MEVQEFDLVDMDDLRQVELSSLVAIFPEMQLTREKSADGTEIFQIALDLPVNPVNPVTVFFPAAATTTGDGPGRTFVNNANGNRDNHAAANPPMDSHELAYLPPVHIQMTLGAEYPSEKPPTISISTTPPWLPSETIKKLEDDGPRLWEEMDHDMVVYSYIDNVQVLAEQTFALVDDKGALKLDAQHKIAILDFDIKAKRAAFEKGTFDCGVCLDPKKGSVCHRMLECGHVFCVECLQDFYNNTITEGNLSAVRCLDPGCAQERETAAEALSGGKRRKKRKNFYLSPSELLQIPLEHDMVKRYVDLKYKTELEADKKTIYCPRQWCQGAARSKKHRKPDGLDFSIESDEDLSSDDEDEAEDLALATGDGDAAAAAKGARALPLNPRLVICSDCGFAFCARCQQSWHGEFSTCRPKKGEMSAEELANIEYMRLHTTPCPTCSTPAQKTHGCNHMICTRCQTHFCYLCAHWLDPYNPYDHFNEDDQGRKTGCYMRLWELENGDGAEAGYAGGLAGGPPLHGGGGDNRAAAPAVQPAPPPPGGGGARAAAPAHPVPEIEEAEEDEAVEAALRAAREAELAPNDPQNGGQVGVAREGPLVLRIAGNAVPPAAPPAAARAGAGGPRAAAPVRGGGVPPAVPQAPAPRRGAGVRQQQQQQQRRHARGGHGGRGAGRGRGGAAPRLNNPGEPAGDLDAEQEAWIRHFVQAALNDEEDLVFEHDVDDDFGALFD